MIARRKAQGFTLIEMLLVMVIISIIIYASISYLQQRALQLRMDRTSTQMQQIMNAALSYYVFNGHWPTDAANDPPIKVLQNTGFLPPITLTSPWGNSYLASFDTKQFYVWVQIKLGTAAYGAANIIAGTLPLSYTSTDPGAAPNTPPASGSVCVASSTSCNVVSSVNIPGQNLNNASAVNFAGMYYNGGCVPVPACPVDSATGSIMQPIIVVSAGQVSGTNDTAPTPPNGPNVYPISSFTAYAVGGVGSGTNPAPCVAGGLSKPCAENTGVTPAADYWRVCIQVVTEKGTITSTSTTWGQNQKIMALTRCQINGEPNGGGFSIYND